MLDSMLVPPSHRTALETAIARYATTVEFAGEYLAGRGITKPVAVAARLGFVSDPMPGHERFQGMLCIPYLTPAGPVAIKFRRIEGEGQKYDAPSGQHLRLYNVDAFFEPGDVIVLCEGELDALMCHRVVGVPAVGAPGTNFAEHWPRCFADHDRVLIVADNDLKDDGSNPGLKHAKSVQQKIPNSTIILPPAGLDLGEWVLRDGVDEVRRALGV